MRIRLIPNCILKFLNTVSKGWNQMSHTETHDPNSEGITFWSNANDKNW